jgi:predicted permease
MNPFDSIRRLARILPWWRTVERDVDDELTFHLAARIDDLEREGHSHAEAKRIAAQELGSFDAARAELVAIDRRRASKERKTAGWSDLSSDVRFSFRLIRRFPGFSTLAILTMALGIAANSVVFSLVNAALLHPLPYPDSDRLVHLWETKQNLLGGRSEASYLDLLDWRAQNASFTAIEGYSPGSVSLAANGTAEVVRVLRVTSGFSELLGVRPHLGRMFRADEDGPAGSNAVILSYGLWSRRFGENPRIVDSVVTIDGTPSVVVGVLPRSFSLALSKGAELWLPLADPYRLRDLRNSHWVNCIARLRPGVSLEAARTDLATIMTRLAQQYPESNRGRAAVVVRLQDEVVGVGRQVLTVLMGAVGALLLIACANVASLVAARTLARQREFVVRTALGASRGRLVRQLTVESLLLATTGALLGTLAAGIALRAVTHRVPLSLLERIPYLGQARLEGPVIAYIATATLFAVLLFGMLPALATIRPKHLTAALSGGRTGTSRHQTSLRDALLVVQVALTVVLLVGTVLLARSFVTLINADPGYDADHVNSVRLALSGSRYRSPESQQRFFEDVLRQVRALPGVREVGAITKLPLNGGGTNSIWVVGAPEPEPGHVPEAVLRGVAGRYFETMRIPITTGRGFLPTDDSTAARAAIVSQTLAARLFGTQPAVGQRIKLDPTSPVMWTVIGVAGDVRVADLDADPPPTVYLHHLQMSESGMALVVRAETSGTGLDQAIRDVVRRIDPGVPVYAAQTLTEAIAESPAVLLRRYPLVIVGGFGLVALVLAVVGLYGVIAHSVSQRTRELGVRMALGATAPRIVGLVLRRGVSLALIGVALGASVALALGSFLQALLYGVRSSDPLSLAVVGSILVLVAAAASALPARRAARIDPIMALRSE